MGALVFNIFHCALFRMFTPKIWSLLRHQGYSISELRADLISGFTVSIIALPLSIALAIASGAEPQQGIITAVVAGFMISLLGGSRVQIGGPTGAFVVIVYKIILSHGYIGLLLSCFMAGIILIVAGFLRLGNLIKFFSKPVIMGFTSGIAVIILVSQIEYILGLSITEKMPAEFVSKLVIYYKHANSINIKSLALSVFLVALFIYIKKHYPRTPPFLIMVVIGAGINYFFGLELETIGSKFGRLSASLNLSELICLSNIHIKDLIELLPSAIIIATLAGIESLLSAIVADSTINDRHKPNAELIGLGIANIFSSIFGGLPATGAIARTAANIKSGGKTPMAGIFHSLFIFIIAYAFSGFLIYIPLSTLAAILIIVAFYMGEVKESSYLLKNAPKEDKMIFLLTFIFTVLTDLTIGVTIGFIISVLLFISSISNKIGINLEDRQINENKKLPQGVRLISFNGPLFFGSSNRIYDALESTGEHFKVIIIDLTNVSFLDITASYALKELFDRFASKYELILSIKQSDERLLLEKLGVKSKLKATHIVSDNIEAIKLSETIVSQEKTT